MIRLQTVRGEPVEVPNSENFESRRTFASLQHHALSGYLLFAKAGRIVKKACKHPSILARLNGEFRLKYKILGWVAVALLAAPLGATAQSTTYTYQGDTFTSGSVNITPPAGATSINVPANFGVGALTGFITLSAPLGDNLNNVSVTPTFIDIVSGSPLFRGVFTFSTDGNGAIDGWSMSLDGSVPGPGGYTLTATSVDVAGVGGDSATLSTTCTAHFSAPPGAPQSFNCGATGSNAKIGVWTSAATRAPELDAASAAGCLTLLLGGLAVMQGRWKRR